jgi:hypothetical protein
MERPLFLLFFCCLPWLSCHQHPGHSRAGENKASSELQTGTGTDANDSDAEDEEPLSKDSISDGSGAGTTPNPQDDSSGNAAQGIARVDAGGVVPNQSLLNLKSFPKVSVEQVLSQDWKFDDADQPHWNEIFWDSAQDKRQFPELALFPDHTFTENVRARLRMGKWKLNKQTRELALHFEDGRSKAYLIGDLAMKQMGLNWKRGTGMANIRVSATAIVHRLPGEDPFYPANNRWRLKPRTPEPDEQIRRRLKGFVHFFALFFRDNYLRRDSDISYVGLPCCFNWYNGGIGMQAKPEVDSRWVES